MGDTFHWLDVDLIAEELVERYPDHDPITISFPDLKRLVEELDDFEEQRGHPCNERILEAIQASWIRERADLVDDDDEDR
ncbi:MAG: Fe-S cluster assembly protein IscX [Phycisphaerales bacterium]|nr:Fe-S cluster assembly protein IscX [Phycisphaerales bacterium]